MPKLTKSLVEKAEPRKTRYMIFDEQLPGFCLSVSPNGRRFYYLQYMKNKRVKRMSIGMHGILTTEEARDQAIKLLAEVKSGGDPQRVAQEKRQEPYMDELCERYMDEHVAIHCKPRTQAGYAWLMKKFIKPYFRDMKVSEVTRADVAAFHHKMRGSPYNANRALEMISKMFQLAELWGLRPDHSNPPAAHQKIPDEIPRALPQ